MATFVIQLKGIPVLLAKLDSLETVLSNRIIRESCRTGANIILPAVQSATSMFRYRWPLPKGRNKGDLKKGLKVRALRRSRDTIGVTMLSTLKQGPTTATSQYQTDLYYGAFVNWGHKLGKRPRKGQPDHRKKIKPVPYMDTGFKRSHRKATYAIRLKFKESVEKYWNTSWRGAKAG